MPAIRPNARPYCYICGATEKLTDDHLPPRGFCPPTHRSVLITAPLCQACHRPLANDDEAMRLWLSSHIQASEAGRWIWKNKVLTSTLARSPKLLQNIQPYLKRINLDTAEGQKSAAVFSMDQSRAVPFIRRLTKGLLYRLHPEYDYFPDHFRADYMLETLDNVAVVKELLSGLEAYQRSNEVFRVWHGIVKDTDEGGAWVYLFYDAVCFVCIHSKRPDYEQSFPQGYSEHPKLPPHL